MLSLSSLLNPISISDPRRIDPPPSSSYYSPSTRNKSPHFTSQPSSTKSKMSKDGAVFSKGKIKGRVLFPPLEDLDQDSLQAVGKYRVFPLGEIVKYPRHIPYNSEKKSFLEKTGRESFEVFQYTFQLPGEDKEYTVMWDYNIGLVRITPFFKCSNYSKTIPAKMLNMNPGLKEITHSITGGALAAQGYWMPYPCALAVCATFCAHISGALIPLFGPTFPARCVPKESHLYGRMVIDSSIIIRGTEEALAFRAACSPGPTSNPSTRSQIPTPSPSIRTARTFDSVSPRSIPGDFPPHRDHGRKRLRMKRGPNPRGNYTDTDSEPPHPHDRDRPLFPSSIATPMMAYATPPPPSTSTLGYTSSGWTPTNSHPHPYPHTRFAQHNHAAFAANASSHERPPPNWRPLTFGPPHTPEPSPVASPWLSAIPRGSGEQGGLGIQGRAREKIPVVRRADVGLGIRGVELETRSEEVYDADSDGSEGVSPKRVKGGRWSRDAGRGGEDGFDGSGAGAGVDEDAGTDTGTGGGLMKDVEKSAALMLMCLSVGDAKGEMQGVKRKRAVSL